MIHCLDDIETGRSARIVAIEAPDDMRRRLMDIGLVKNTAVECVGKSPLGDPKAFLIRGAVIAIRSADCRKIIICAQPEDPRTAGDTYGIRS